MEEFRDRLSKIYEERYEPTKESIEGLKEYLQSTQWQSMDQMVIWLLTKGYKEGVRRSINECEQYRQVFNEDSHRESRKEIEHQHGQDQEDGTVQRNIEESD